jgi:D-sedoheptulose 7-phosphate isomerase
MDLDDIQYGKQYIEKLIADINNIPVDTIAEIAGVFRKAREEGKRLYFFGNGGSASAVSHMVCDLGKNTRKSDQPRLKVISLVETISMITAYANDDGYENIFSEPLISLAEPGDIALAISGSGNSPNVLKGMAAAKNIGMTTIGLTGFQGGKLKDIVDICLVVKSTNMERIEDVHLVINHILTGLIRGSEYGC